MTYFLIRNEDGSQTVEDADRDETLGVIALGKSGRYEARDIATRTVSHHWTMSEAAGAIVRRTRQHDQDHQDRNDGQMTATAAGGAA